jgi:hypothetical protein
MTEFDNNWRKKIVAYTVQNMTLIPQGKAMSCWYASAQMLIKWKEESSQQSLANLLSPEMDTECQKIRDADNGIANSQILSMAKRLGLKSIPPQSPTPEALETWFQTYGPLWVNGKNHIVVIAGIRNSGAAGYELKVYDPLPVNVGKIEWRSLANWYASGGSISTRDTASDVQAVFLYVP